MKRMYTAAFLLPTPVEKDLTDAGWEFASQARLPEQLLSVLIKAFAVRARECYLDMDVFEGQGLKITAVRDAVGQIENVAVQLRGTKADELRAALISAGLGEIEVFVPSAQILEAG